ncbi:MAG: extracellular solute-binding protein, partial [Clostridia bacterium]|nr:extracellular solute-binding protein [Clostridia bacterium]
MGEIGSISVAADGGLVATLSNLPSMPDTSEEAGEEGDSPKGRIMFTPDNMETTVVWYTEQGLMGTHFTVRGILSGIAALNGQRLAAQEMGFGGAAVTVYDSMGKNILSIGPRDFSNLTAGPDGESLFLVQPEKISQMDLAGSTIRTIPWTQDFMEQLAVAADGTLFLANAAGLYSAKPDDLEMIHVADTARYLIGAPDSGFSNLCVLKDGTLLAHLAGGSVMLGAGRVSMRIGGPGGGAESKLVAYVYSAQMDMSGNTEFTVSALRNTTKLRKAVSDFQRIHPELTVRFSASLEETDIDTPVEDAIRILNTDLLAGKGGDVLILDELPMRQYISKGVLMPLDEVLAGIGFLPGILESSRAADGRLYAMPAQFRFDTLWGRKNQVEGVRSLGSMAEIPLDHAQDLLRPLTAEELLEMFYPASQSGFLDGTGHPRFDTPEFEAFLDALYGIYSAQAVQPNDVSGSPGNGPKMNMEELQGMMNGSIALMSSGMSGTLQTALPYTISGASDGAFIVVPAMDGAGRTYTPSLMGGIGANTAHPELAAEFLRSLYAPELQELDGVDGFPTVSASLNKLFADAKARNKEKNLAMVLSLGDGNPIQMEQPDDATWDAVRAACDTLTAPYIDDPTLMSFIVEETASFFEGRTSAQDAARALQQRAMAYLNE